MRLDFVGRIHVAILNLWSWWWQVSNTKDEFVRGILTVSIIVLPFLWYKRIFQSPKPTKPPLPPGPQGLPIVGYLPFLGTNLHEVLANLASRYGPIYKLRLGSKLHVVVNSSDLAKSVVRDHDASFSNRDPPLVGKIVTYGGFDILWSNNDSYWRTMRKMFVNEVLSNTNLDACSSFRRDEVRKTIKNVFAKVGSNVDINEISFQTELRVILRMTWGNTTTADLDAEFRQVVWKIVELLGSFNLSDFIPVLARFDLQGVQRDAKMQQERLDRIFDGIIEERMKFKTGKSIEKEGRKDFLQIMLDLKNAHTTSFSNTQIKAILTDIVVGGTDTTATMVEWTMAEILNHPIVMEKVQSELTHVVGTNGMVEESHLPKLQYLNAVIKETFRLHPPFPLLVPRCPDNSCTVGEFIVPKGTIVYLNVWAIHRDPKNWDDPLEFNPERFFSVCATNKQDYNGHNLKFFPFGSGRRICAGIPLAEKMVAYILASLLHSFDWSIPAGEEIDLSEQFGFVLKKKTSLVTVPSKRLSDTSLYY